MPQQHEITAWLEDADLTPDQIEEFTRLVTLHEDTVIPARPDYGTPDYSSADYADEDTAAWIAALEIVEGTFDLEARGKALLAARADAQQGAIMAVLAGNEEAPTARAAAVSRPWLRKQIGK
ncbi:hypothetical protein [Leucobacter aridicollis]|uniref:hypothetical protein n=1 Tax=Leucobacter aridicollis TaxID=283878 RepID=UPI002106A50D|nr:hypothetical protein [Leucobacter aridicollis]UTX53273.1 hypothetical protein KI794_00440 [Leucobacter aridicollis]